MTDNVLLAQDGTSLKQKLHRTNRLNRMTAFGLVTPLLAFIVVTFMVPIGMMLFRSIDNPTIIDRLPETVGLIQQWDGKDLPSEAVYKSIVIELSAAFKRKEHAKVGTRLNYVKGGLRSLITRSARKMAKIKEGPYKEQLIKVDKRWGENENWVIFKQESPAYTGSYYLAALDFKKDLEGDIIRAPEDNRIYVTLFMRTLYISLTVTMFCIILAYPLSYYLSVLPARISKPLMIMVLLPFWTSLLVRTTSWIVLLQTEGVLNDIAVWIGIVGEDGRIQMIYNMPGTVVAMTHILLPFMVLPLYSVMKTISPSYMRAATSLGATPKLAFIKVYAPLTIPGVGAGSILVFILAVGYYITPALVGGRTGQLISNFIAFHMQKSLNWGLAAALGTILLIGVLALYWLYNRIVGTDNMKLG